MQKVNIRVGHSAYGSWCLNHAVICHSKTAAVKELCNRFVSRATARKVIEQTIKQGYGAFVSTQDNRGIDYGIELSIY